VIISKGKNVPIKLNQCLQRYSAEIIASLTGYAYLREAVHALQC